MRTIGDIRAAFFRVHNYATGTSKTPYMSIPPNENDADLIVCDAISELEDLRADSASLRQGVERLREPLNPLVYWHDQGHIDESWWEDARAALRETEGLVKP